MKGLLAVPVILISFTLPALAQRGGGGHAGTAAAAAGARGGFAPAARSGAPTAGSRGQRGGVLPGAAATSTGYRGGSPQSLFPPPGITSTRPVFYSNGIRRYAEPGGRGERSRVGYGGVGFVSLGYPGYLDAGYLDSGWQDAGYGDSGYLGDFDAANAPYPQASAQDALENGPSEASYGAGYEAGMSAARGGSAYGPSGEPPTEEAPPPPYLSRPEPRTQAMPAPASTLPEEDAVTIVFKDGRPSEQIHNYALTRTMLYITGSRVRSIPVDQIDLAATAKVNEKAGVEFQLPATK